jgi:predicted transcriptional regulator
MEEGFRVVELSQLELRYAHTRIHRKDALLRMADSIERFGQITPVGVVAAFEDTQFVLIDGYLRADAIRRCAKDTIKARILAKDVTTALIEILTQSRRWDVIEQAGILRELHLGHGLSQAKIASLMGRDQSWVSRRLSLLNALSEDLVKAILSGKIASWVACRVLAPMARANAEHARRLIAHCDVKEFSCRDFARFYSHYKDANRKVRENMIDSPQLFLKALEQKLERAQAKTIRDGPEGLWRHDMTIVGHILARLIKKVPAVFYAGQSNLDRRGLLTAFSDARDLFLALEQRVNDEIARASASHCDPCQTGSLHPQNLPYPQSVTKHGTSAAAG